ncbi:MAG: stage II sporulation protein P [Firmicutes bacterium]|nr:stage II sporulation protein P [Bacillota bacterium]
MRKCLTSVMILLGVLAVLTVASWQQGYLPEPVAEAISPVFNSLGVIGMGKYEMERDDGRYYTVIDSRGRVLMETALPVFVGDEYIAEDNRHYRITQIQGDTAQAELIGYEEIALSPEEEAAVAALAQTVEARGGAKVGIYHTHDDEAYVPSDGKASIKGGGGIKDVAAQLQKAIQAKGITCDLNDASHAPHDANAYHRSRRTAMELMRKARPQILLDVHRDAVPARAYQSNVGGQDCTKVKLVVGRQNPRYSANLSFAKKVKAVMDKTHPGLSKGIFIGRGSYNQDLSPAALLIEVGADKNSKDQAMRGVTLFADVIPQVLGVATAAPGAPGAAVGRVVDTGGSGRAIAWILGILIVAGGAFLLLSAGNWPGAVGKLRQLGGKEWANLLGKVRVLSRRESSSDSTDDRQEK